MRASSLTLALLFVVCISNSATTQQIHWEDPQNELWLDEVEVARNFNRFGDCAHDDPALAVRACTQQLMALHMPNSGSYRSDRAHRFTLRANARVKQGNFRVVVQFDHDASCDASQSSSTFTISDISQSLVVTPAAIAGVTFKV